MKSRKNSSHWPRKGSKKWMRNRDAEIVEGSLCRSGIHLVLGFGLIGNSGVVDWEQEVRTITPGKRSIDMIVTPSNVITSCFVAEGRRLAGSIIALETVVPPALRRAEDWMNSRFQSCRFPKLFRRRTRQAFLGVVAFEPSPAFPTDTTQGHFKTTRMSQMSEQQRSNQSSIHQSPKIHALELMSWPSGALAKRGTDPEKSQRLMRIIDSIPSNRRVRNVRWPIRFDFGCSKVTVKSFAGSRSSFQLSEKHAGYGNKQPVAQVGARVSSLDPSSRPAHARGRKKYITSSIHFIRSRYIPRQFHSEKTTKTPCPSSQPFHRSIQRPCTSFFQRLVFNPVQEREKGGGNQARRWCKEISGLHPPEPPSEPSSPHVH